MQNIKTHQNETRNRIVEKLIDCAKESVQVLISVYTELFSAEIPTYIEEAYLEQEELIINTKNNVSFNIQIEGSEIIEENNEGYEVKIQKKDETIVFSVCEDF